MKGEQNGRTNFIYFLKWLSEPDFLDRVEIIWRKPVTIGNSFERIQIKPKNIKI
jgi:hypothetical protein